MSEERILVAYVGRQRRDRNLLMVRLESLDGYKESFEHHGDVAYLAERLRSLRTRRNLIFVIGNYDQDVVPLSENEKTYLLGLIRK